MHFSSLVISTIHMFQLRPVSKVNSGFRKIHYLSFLLGFFVNNRIFKKAAHFYLTKLENFLQQAVEARRHFTFIKGKIKNIFRNISLTLHF